ncbi:hypothetical protein TA3x_002779 [Tundrisphaera sp. TA3]|uniref:hypothetical protein n=1 Tax=Tundrisphaera sp. TA3 TaxID=3435775 RepID=UPI003EB9A305
MATDIPRRDALRAGLASMSFLALGQAPRLSGVASFRLIEREGLRRMAEPVSTTLPVPGRGLGFRLVRDGRAIPAQFRPAAPDPACPGIRLDFAADLGPGEVARYEVHFGPAVESGPDPAARWALDPTPDEFIITRDRVELFSIDRSLRDPGRPSGPAPREGLMRLAPGPSIFLRDGRRIRPGSATGTITREGPFAIGLRFAWDGPPGVASTLDLDFPTTRDQAIVAWTVQDPDDRAATLEFELDRPGLGPGGVRVESEPGTSPRWAMAEGPHRRILAVADGPDGPVSIGFPDGARFSISRRFPTASRVKSLAFRLDLSRPDRPSERGSSLRSLLWPIRLEWDQPVPAPG